MTIEKVINLNTILKRIIDDTSLKIDALLKFKFLGILKQFESTVNNFDVIRNEKVKEYGTEHIGEDGNSTGEIEVLKDDVEKYTSFINDLQSILLSETDIQIKKLKPDEIFNCGLPADYLMALYDIIEQ